MWYVFDEEEQNYRLQLWRVYKTLCELCHDRGFTTELETDKKIAKVTKHPLHKHTEATIDLQDFFSYLSDKEKESKREMSDDEEEEKEGNEEDQTLLEHALEIRGHKISNQKQTLLVCFSKAQKELKAAIDLMIKRLRASKTTNGIFIALNIDCKEKSIDALRQYARGKAKKHKGLSVSCFSKKELLCNLTHNLDFNPHYALTPEEEQERFIPFHLDNDDNQEIFKGKVSRQTLPLIRSNSAECIYYGFQKGQIIRILVTTEDMADKPEYRLVV